MKSLTLVLAGLGLALSVSAQEAGLPAPPDRPATGEAASDDDDDSLGEADGSMRRALAYTQRGLIGDLLQSPGSLQASSASQLAAELKIPEVHARTLIEGAQSGTQVEKLNKLLALGLPEGKTVPSGVKLDKLSAGEVSSKLGLTEAEAQRFQRFRESARRVHARFREARALEEARKLGAEMTRERVGRLVTGTPGERVRILVEALGYEAPKGDSAEARRAREGEARAYRAGATPGEVLAEFRDANGKIEWGRLSKSNVAGGASGFGQFALALFLKELMVAAQTGDSARVQSFLDDMTKADFLIDYSLFAGGAKAADALYGRHARRYFQQGKLSGFFRTHFVLAAGLAVPSIARGRFELDEYAVDLVSLSLSVTAVKTLSALGRGALPLRRATTLNGARLFKLGGWVYTVGETAVVLWLADGLAQRVDRYLDERRLRGALEGAEERLKSLVGDMTGEDGEVDLDAVARALDELNAVYDAARSSATQPLFEAAHDHQEEVAAVTAAIGEATVEGEARAERLAEHPELAALLAEREGTLTGKPDAEVAALESELDALNARFEKAFAAVLHQAYEGAVQPGGAPEAGSRLASYEAQIAGLLDALELTSDPDLKVAIALRIAELRQQHDLDEALLAAATAGPAAPAPEEAPTAGVADAVRSAAE
ncbi:MAG: hypothetical protein R3F62_23440 [Planctomycetota bacterium]